MPSQEPSPSPLQVLYEDNHVIAVLKPAGVSVQGDETGNASLLDQTKAWLKAKYQKSGNVFLGLVHRLDKPVSGVIIFGKTSKGASRLSEQFRGRTVQKTYWALVEGRPAEASGLLFCFLASPTEKEPARVVSSGTPGARSAELRFRLLRSSAQSSLLEVDLLTGRKHQIRCQLAHAGHPIVNDVRYGAKQTGAYGIGLASVAIQFSHPVRSGERVEVRYAEANEWAAGLLK